jgi:hypothetical protein
MLWCNLIRLKVVYKFNIICENVTGFVANIAHSRPAPLAPDQTLPSGSRSENESTQRAASMHTYEVGAYRGS